MQRCNVYLLTAHTTDVPPTDHWLTPGECQTLCRLRIPKRRNDWRLGRWTAKRAVQVYQERGPIDFGSIEIRAADSGAPEVWIEGQPAPLVISLSHTTDTALCSVAAAGVALGCDVESVESRSAVFARDYFTAAERAALRNIPVGQRDSVVTLLWSAKESTLKARREGLRADTRDVEVIAFAVPREATWQSVQVRHAPSGVLFFGWWRLDRRLATTVVAAPRPKEPVELAAIVERRGTTTQNGG